jgi:hypothetical protein
MTKREARTKLLRLLRPGSTVYLFRVAERAARIAAAPAPAVPVAPVVLVEPNAVRGRSRVVQFSWRRLANTNHRGAVCGIRLREWGAEGGQLELWPLLVVLRLRDQSECCVGLILQ